MPALLVLALPLGALASPIARPQATASSSYPTENGVRYDERNLVDRRVETAWIEGERGSGLGAWFQLDFPEAREVRAIKLWNGNWASGDLWVRHNRVKDIELTFEDGSKAAFTLKDVHEPETVVLPKPVRTAMVKLKVKSVYGGTTFGDTPLSEVVVLDTAPDDHPVPEGARASSSYPADADATYDAWSVLDGMVDTAWCEGGTTGDGTGEWLEFRFPAATSIGSVTVYNGAAGSMDDNRATSQPTSISLSFDDGSTETRPLKASPLPQTLTFPARSTRSVRVTVDAVAKGATYDDVCVSELRFGS